MLIKTGVRKHGQALQSASVKRRGFLRLLDTEHDSHPVVWNPSLRSHVGIPWEVYFAQNYGDLNPRHVSESGLLNRAPGALPEGAVVCVLPRLDPLLVSGLELCPRLRPGPI